MMATASIGQSGSSASTPRVQARTSSGRASLSWRLSRTVLLSVTAALAVMTLCILWGESTRWAAEKGENLGATAQVLASSVSAAVTAGDRPGIEQSLRAVGRVRGLLYASVADRDGHVLATSGLAVRLSDDLDLDREAAVSPWRLWAARTVKMRAEIVHAGLPVGQVTIISDTADLTIRLRQVLVAGLWTGLFAALAGIAFAAQQAQALVRPLANLTRAMSQISRDHAYTADVPVQGQDEVAVLATAFNTMMHEVRAREQEIVMRLARAAEFRDTDTGEHVSRVAQSATLIARSLGLEDRRCEMVGFASTMHDVGKLGVPDAILLKGGPLTSEERAEMELHAEVGHRILDGSRSEPVQLAAEIALNHHERWDGTGYPRKIAGDAIPLPARIVAVADVLDALTSERPYKKAWAPDQALTYISEQAGTHFDPACVDALVEVWDEVLPLIQGRSEDPGDGSSRRG